MRDPHGKIRWSTKLTKEQRLTMTPFPCGRCLPCKLNKARTWQHRIMLETKSHAFSIFVTLTYAEEYVPFNMQGDLILQKKDLQKFLKRLRRKYNAPIRYFAVGEYGDRTDRPHYHLCIFGMSIEDTPCIESAWSKKHECIGNIHTGNVEKESARYIAGYTIKKLTNKDDSRLYGRTPEFMLSSRRGGGIGSQEVRRIGKILKENPHYDCEEISTQFTIGGKQFPLGQYLTQILRDTLEIKQETLDKRFQEFQQEIFLNHQSHNDSYYDNLVQEENQFRLSLEKKQTINKKEKIL